MTKKAYGAILAKVRELTARQTGASLKETAEGIGKTQNVASVYIAQILKAQEIVRVGQYGEYRYFKDPELAKAYDVVAAVARKQRIAESKKRKNDNKAKKQREERARARAARGQAPIGQYVRKPYVPKTPKSPLQRKMPQNIVLQTTQQAKDQLREHKAATIIWPEHVKVQRIPTPEDVRFKANQGYIGPFMREYLERRAA